MNLKDAEGFTPMHWAANEGLYHSFISFFLFFIFIVLYFILN